MHILPLVIYMVHDYSFFGSTADFVIKKEHLGFLPDLAISKRQRGQFNSIQFKALFRVDINHTYNTSSNELLKSTMVYNNTYNHAYKHIK